MAITDSIPPYALASLSVVGALFLFKIAFSLLHVLSSLFLVPGIPVSKFRTSPQSYALVTGATDGIGLEFARQLAHAKFNLILVSRTQSRLDVIASTIQASYKVQVKVLAMDFAAPTPDDWAKLQELISTLEISVLINNVGRSHNMPVPFSETPADELHGIIEINCMSTLKLTHLVLPRLLSRNRKPGLVLTVASFAGGVVPTPLLATYSGSKAFLVAWSQAMASELRAQNITVEVVCSYLVTSKLSKVRKTSLLIPNPKQFVRSVLTKIGNAGGAVGRAGVSTPYWSHGLMEWAIGLVGRDGAFVIDQNRTMHESIRRRALRKLEREGMKAK